MSRQIRNSAKALIIKDGKMFAIKIKDGDEEWYIMPGGGQDSEEALSDAVLHRVDLIFLCEYIREIENAELQSDTNQEGFEWLDINTLNHSKLYPSKLRRQIMNLYEKKGYQVYLGNEEIGDPEVTE